MSGRCALYRHFDVAGSLLYVGISETLMQRQKQHRLSKPWFALVRTITTEWFESTEDARIAESKAIGDELPLFNKKGAPRGFNSYAILEIETGLIDGWYSLPVTNYCNIFNPEETRASWDELRPSRTHICIRGRSGRIDDERILRIDSPPAPIEDGARGEG